MKPALRRAAHRAQRHAPSRAHARRVAAPYAAIVNIRTKATPMYRDASARLAWLSAIFILGPFSVDNYCIPRFTAAAPTATRRWSFRHTERQADDTLMTFDEKEPA